MSRSILTTETRRTRSGLVRLFSSCSIRQTPFATTRRVTFPQAAARGPIAIDALPVGSRLNNTLTSFLQQGCRTLRQPANTPAHAGLMTDSNSMTTRGAGAELGLRPPVNSKRADVALVHAMGAPCRRLGAARFQDSPGTRDQGPGSRMGQATNRLAQNKNTLPSATLRPGNASARIARESSDRVSDPESRRSAIVFSDAGSMVTGALCHIKDTTKKAFETLMNIVVRVARDTIMTPLRKGSVMTTSIRYGIVTFSLLVCAFGFQLCGCAQNTEANVSQAPAQRQVQPSVQETAQPVKQAQVFTPTQKNATETAGHVVNLTVVNAPDREAPNGRILPASTTTQPSVKTVTNAQTNTGAAGVGATSGAFVQTVTAYVVIGNQTPTGTQAQTPTNTGSQVPSNTVSQVPTNTGNQNANAYPTASPTQRVEAQVPVTANLNAAPGSNISSQQTPAMRGTVEGTSQSNDQTAQVAELKATTDKLEAVLSAFQKVLERLNTGVRLPGDATYTKDEAVTVKPAAATKAADTQPAAK